MALSLPVSYSRVVLCRHFFSVLSLPREFFFFFFRVSLLPSFFFVRYRVCVLVWCQCRLSSFFLNLASSKVCLVQGYMALPVFLCSTSLSCLLFYSSLLFSSSSCACVLPPLRSCMCACSAAAQEERESTEADKGVGVRPCLSQPSFSPKPPNSFLPPFVSSPPHALKEVRDGTPARCRRHSIAQRLMCGGFVRAPGPPWAL